MDLQNYYVVGNKVPVSWFKVVVYRIPIINLPQSFAKNDNVHSSFAPTGSTMAA